MSFYVEELELLLIKESISNSMIKVLIDENFKARPSPLPACAGTSFAEDSRTLLYAAQTDRTSP